MLREYRYTRIRPRFLPASRSKTFSARRRFQAGPEDLITAHRQFPIGSSRPRLFPHLPARVRSWKCHTAADMSVPRAIHTGAPIRHNLRQASAILQRRVLNPCSSRNLRAKLREIAAQTQRSRRVGRQTPIRVFRTVQRTSTIHVVSLVARLFQLRQESSEPFSYALQRRAALAHSPSWPLGDERQSFSDRYD